MHCPNDGTILVIADRNGVGIDYCPRCRGVWLKRGELDKILDRSASAMRPKPPRPTPYTRQPQIANEGDFLGELFDF